MTEMQLNLICILRLIMDIQNKTALQECKKSEYEWYIFFIYIYIYP